MEQLAIDGGKPVREKLLPYGSQWISEEDIDQVLQVLRSDYLTQGPKILEFERSIAEVAGTEYAVAFCNGTAALHGACFAAGITTGDEVITSPLTFAASSNCVLYVGGTPVFADVNPDTYLLDIHSVKEKLTSRTKAIIPVDFAGQPVNMRQFKSFAEENGLVMIQDAAHSLGAAFGGEPVGAIADMTMFSFHPVKPVTTGEGGVIVTNNPEYYRLLLLFRSHGITRDSETFINESEGPWYYEMQELGYNYRLSDMQAALGLSQMNRLYEFIQRRNDIASSYSSLLEDLELEGLIRRPHVNQEAVSGWHIYMLNLELVHLTCDRKQIFNALRAENIGVNVHYIPVYKLPYYQSLGYKNGLCPQAEKLYEGFITLPIFPKMTEQDILDVVNSIYKVVRMYASK